MEHGGNRRQNETVERGRFYRRNQGNALLLLRYAMPLRQVYDRTCTGVLFFICFVPGFLPFFLLPSSIFRSFHRKRYLLIGVLLYSRGQGLA